MSSSSRNVDSPRGRWLVGALLVAAELVAAGCGVLGPPGGERPRPVSPVAARPTPTRPVPAQPANQNPAPEPAGPSSEVSPLPPVRLLRPPAEAGAAEAASTAPKHGYAPDPAPLSTRAWWAYDVRYDRGAIEPGAPALQCLEQPATSARRLGRFAFELWIGSELIERVRFDFPLLAGAAPRTGPRRPLREEPSFAPGARVSTRVRIPASPRATRAQILDRATGQTIPVPWPPAASAGQSGDTGRSNATSAPCGNAAVTTSPATPTPPAR